MKYFADITAIKHATVEELVEELGGEVVKMLFLIELSDLNGREVLKDYDVDSVVQFEGK